MKARLYPDWAMPNLMSIGMDYRKARGILGGVARKRNLTAKRLREIAMMGVRARAKKSTQEQRRQHASNAAKAANAKRWAGHVKKPKPAKKPRGHNASHAGKMGAEARWGTPA